MILFEFSIRDRHNIPQKKLIEIAYEELATEAQHRKWAPGFQLIQACFPIRQLDGSLLYTFLVLDSANREVKMARRTHKAMTNLTADC